MTDAICRIVSDAALDFFVSYGSHLQPLSVSSLTLTLDPVTAAASKLTFGGNQLQGSFFIAGTFDFFAACRPLHTGGKDGEPLSWRSAGDWIYLRDWTKELANQMFGRVKNKLLTHSIVINPGLPSALSGQPVQNEVALRGRPLVRLGDGKNQVLVWFDAVVKPGVVLTLAERKTTHDIREGDIVLF